MKILHLYRCKTAAEKPSPLIDAQIISLSHQGVEAEGFPITGNSVFTYLRQSRQLRKHIRENDCDIIHAHYALCAITAVLARTGKPIVLSMMGSDILGEYDAPDSITFRSRIVIFISRIVQYFVTAVIAKSHNIYERIGRKKITVVVPNGVNMKRFQPMDKAKARHLLGLPHDKKYVLSLANPAHFWKNPGLTTKALQLLKHPDLVLLTPYPLAHHGVPLYLNAADVFISTSWMEGSSNVIKEAMACNCPLVATNVGDAAWIVDDTAGCYLSNFDPADTAEKLTAALSFAEKHNRTAGRNRILHLGLDEASVANRIIDVYKKVL
jgi:teichuronic acid biosynthesis glycosyltransferase TuaC